MSKSNKQLKLVVKNGTITSIHDDALTALYDDAESVDIKRASHVEPVTIVNPGAPCGLWSADLTPVGGPILIGFKTRQQALDAEVRYLNQHVII